MKRLINRLKGFDPKRMIKMINVVKQRSGHSFIWIFLDILRCFIKYGSGYMDYYLFYFEDLSEEEKASYINISVNKKYIRTCNDPDYYHIFHNKIEFLDVYKEFIKRDYLDLRVADFNSFNEFLDKHNEFMAKPDEGLCGYGIELIKVNEVDDREKLYESLKEKELILLEDRIKQDERISKIYPESINTIRVVTLNNEDNVTVLFKALRIGNEGKHVDNFNNSGLICVIEDDGTIIKPALNKANEVFEEHPMTHTKLIGFKIPKYDKIIELVTKLAKVVPEIGIVGWDIAITEDGLDVVEGNEIPGYDIYQSKEHLAPSKYGIKKRFDDAIFPEDKDRIIFGKGHNLFKAIWISFIGFVLDILSFVLFDNMLFFGFYFGVGYLLFDKHIDSRKFYKTIIYSAVIGVIIFFVSYSIVYFSVSSYIDSYFKILTDNAFSLFISLLDYILKAILFVVIGLYFVTPFVDKIMEKANYIISIGLTIVFGCLMLCALIIVLFPIIYALTLI